MRDGATVVLVEGDSDRRALEVLARRLDQDLAASGVDIVPMDGITNLRHHLAALDAQPEPPRVLGLFDAAERAPVARMLTAAGRGPAESIDELEALGFFACTLDLEDELIRAAGPELVEGVLAEHRDLTRFRTFQRQPYHRARSIEAQLHRFAGTAGGRKAWFAADVVEVLPIERMPQPMLRLLDAVAG